jgi:hypothetical protein
MARALPWRRTSVLLIAVGLTTGCLTDTSRSEVSVVQPAATVIPSGTKDPRASAAVSTYAAFNRTLHHALRHPEGMVGSTYPDASDFVRYSADPVQSQYASFISILNRTHHAFRGTPPKSNVTVTSIDLKATPYPLITLSDCQTDRDTWRAYDVRKNTMNPQLTPSVPAPYGITVTVAYVLQRWKVETIKPDPAGMCAG